MKHLKSIFTLALTLLLSGVTHSQMGSINNTLGTGGTFRIRTATDSFFTVTQSTGNVSVFRNLELGGDSLSTSTRGVITKDGRRFIHNYSSPGDVGENTFVGLEAGNFTTGGDGVGYNTGVGYRSLYSLADGGYNSAFGARSLQSNTDGYSNSAFGSFSLYSNTTGTHNSAFGSSALYSNTTGQHNCAFGNFSLLSNTTGYSNSAFGYSSLEDNTTGFCNSAFGVEALFSNTTGSWNSAFGPRALQSNITGIGNTAVGSHSLYSSTGNNNTAIGDSAGSNITTGSNNITIGFNAQVPTNTASNQIRLGNTAITYAGIEVAWTITSDKRNKENISPIGLGLGFISKLNPVSYVRKNDENKKTEYGLIAQEVEQVLKECGIENHAMLTITDEGMYELRYNDLIAPMIKAIQELKEKSDEKDIEIAKLKDENEKLISELNNKETRISSVESQLNEILQVVNELKNKQEDVKNVKLGGK